jgi:hypothetical protein
VLLSGDDPRTDVADAAAQPYTDDAPRDDPATPWPAWHFVISGASVAHDPEDAIIDIGNLMAFQAHAARDLQCSRGEVVVERGAAGPMAEGCGKRATYARGRGPREFDLVSIVPLQGAAGGSGPGALPGQIL